MRPAGLGPGERKAALRAGFSARAIAPSSLEGGLPWYQLWTAVGTFPNLAFSEYVPQGFKATVGETLLVVL